MNTITKLNLTPPCNEFTQIKDLIFLEKLDFNVKKLTIDMKNRLVYVILNDRREPITLDKTIRLPALDMTDHWVDDVLELMLRYE